MSTPFWVDCSSTDAIPTADQIRSWLTDDQHVVLRFPEVVLPGGPSRVKVAIVSQLAAALPECAVFDSGGRDGVEWVTVCLVLSAEEIRANTDAFLNALRLYRRTAATLARQLARHLEVSPDRLLKASGENDAWNGELDTEWSWGFHGCECRFQNASTGQDVEVRLDFGSEFGALDPYFFGRFISTTSELRSLAHVLRDNFHCAARVLDVLRVDGHLRSVEGDTGPGWVVSDPEDGTDGDGSVDWCASTDARQLLDMLQGQVSERKWRLFACGCVRRVWELLADARSKRAVEVAEQVADGLVSELEWSETRAANQEAYKEKEPEAYSNPREYGIALHVSRAANLTLADDIATWVSHVLSEASRAEGLMVRGDEEPGGEEFRQYMKRLQVPYCDTLRCVMGNPNRQVYLEPGWLTSTVVALAKGIYDERTFEVAPILADALEDVGCTDEDVLNHLRGPNGHVRGCWVVDTLLGKL